MPVNKLKETDMFLPIKNYFLEKDCEVFSEVLSEHSSRRADVVVRQDKIITVIEMKTTLSMDLLEQANRWLYKANYVYIAIPHPKDGHINEYARKCLRRDGIGILTVDFRYAKYYMSSIEEMGILVPVTEISNPKLFRRVKTNWDKCLTEEHKNTLIGGSKGGGYITPYSTTISAVKRCLKYHPEGVSLNDIVQKVQTHYCNPKQGLFKALTVFEDDWCDTYTVGRTRYFKIREGVKI